MTAARFLFLLLLLSMTSSPRALAQASDGFGLDRFAPAPTTEDGFALQWPRSLGHLRLGAMLTFDYAHSPLVLSAPDGGESAGSIIAHRLVAHGNVALGLSDRFEVHLRAPITLAQGGDDPAISAIRFSEPDSTSLGDVVLGGSARIIGEDESAFQLGASINLALPTGSRETLSGNGAVTPSLGVNTTYHLDKTTLAANLGFTFRPARDYGTSKLGTEMTFGVGGYQRLSERLMLGAELFGSTTPRDGQTFTRTGTAMELLLGARYALPLGFTISGGPTLGLTQAVGVPDVRLFASIGYPEPRPPQTPPDTDHDGIPDAHDRCPEQAEDFDGFEDADGCPEDDNDNDGILDASDRCPMDPEDVDGFEDEDGCPDGDNDRDGIPDVRDRCPTEPEDKDGFEDDDGCPEDDNDRDGLLDPNDRCPNEAEDFDEWHDDDGCPDPDNDNDTVLDVDDECPTAPGRPENRGCPRAVRIEAGMIKILQRIEFDTNRATLRPTAEPILEEVWQVLGVNPQITKVQIGGHTDSRGPDQKNMTLSQQRAETVMRWLTDHGIEPERLEARGFGESVPLVEGNDETAWQTNRRVEFKIVTTTQTTTAPMTPSATGAGSASSRREAPELTDEGEAMPTRSTTPARTPATAPATAPRSTPAPSSASDDEMLDLDF